MSKLIPAVNSKGKWMQLGLGLVLGAALWVGYNNFLGPLASNYASYAATTEPTYALRRFGGYGNERNVFGSIFDPSVRAYTQATALGDRMNIRNVFRRAVASGVMHMAADKQSIRNNTDRIQRVIDTQDNRLEELLKSTRLSITQLQAEVNAAIHEILQIFSISSMAGVNFGMFPK